MSSCAVFTIPQTCHSGHILLASEIGNNASAGYEVILGGQDNKAVEIKDGANVSSPCVFKSDFFLMTKHRQSIADTKSRPHRSHRKKLLCFRDIC